MDKGIAAVVRQIAENAEAASLDIMDLPGTISTLVKYAAQHQVDPYVTLGVLVESIAHTVAQSIPDQKQIEAAKGVTRLLLERFAAQGLIR